MTISTNCTAVYQTADGFKKIYNAGFRGVDYNAGLDMDAYSLPHERMVAYFEDRKKALDDAGIRAVQVHAVTPTDYDRTQYLSETSKDLFVKQIEAAAILGAPYIVIHPINFANGASRHDEEMKVNLTAFRAFVPALTEHNVQLGIENMWNYDWLRCHYSPTGCSYAEDMIYLIDTLSKESDRFVACLDTGHLFMLQRSPADAARKLGNRLKLMHVHDNFGIPDAHATPGEGLIDWDDYAASLSEVGYKGAFSLEIAYLDIFNHLGEAACDAYLRHAYLAAKAIVDRIKK